LYPSKHPIAAEEKTGYGGPDLFHLFDYSGKVTSLSRGKAVKRRFPSTSLVPVLQEILIFIVPP
jgi:hypothetical protein